MKQSAMASWFLRTLETLAATQGVRALAETEMTVRGLPRWSDGGARVESTISNEQSGNEAVEIAKALGIPARSVVQHWRAIEQHKWTMSEKLSRDVGLKVAALDYFENFGTVERKRETHGLRGVLAAMLRNLDNDGPKSIAAFERAMRGTRSLAN